MLFRRIAAGTFALSHAFTACPAQTPSQKAQSSRDEAEIQAYTLTMDTITRLMQTTHELTLLKPNAEAPKDDADDSKAEQSLEQQTARLAMHPQIVAVLGKYGFTPR